MRLDHLVYNHSSLGPLLTNTDHYRPEAPHTTCCFEDALIRSSCHDNLDSLSNFSASNFEDQMLTCRLISQPTNMPF